MVPWHCSLQGLLLQPSQQCWLQGAHSYKYAHFCGPNNHTLTKGRCCCLLESLVLQDTQRCQHETTRHQWDCRRNAVNWNDVKCAVMFHEKCSLKTYLEMHREGWKDLLRQRKTNPASATGLSPGNSPHQSGRERKLSENCQKTQ